MFWGVWGVGVPRSRKRFTCCASFFGLGYFWAVIREIEITLTGVSGFGVVIWFVIIYRM